MNWALRIIVASLLLTSLACSRSKETYLDRGNAFYTQHKYEDASINYRKAIQKDPKFGEAYYRLALSEMELKKLSEAFQALTVAVQMLPDKEEAKIKLADLALGIYLALPERNANLYQILTAMGDQLLARNPQSYEGLRIKGYLALTDKKPVDAVAYFEKANAIRPMQSELVLVLVQGLFQVGKSEDGEKLAKDLIQANKGYSEIYDALYLHFTSTKRSADAESLRKTQVSNDPKNPKFILALASHYANSGKVQEMQSTLNLLLGNPTDFPDARLQVGDFYRNLGKLDDAIRLYQEGAAGTPKNKRRYQKRISEVLVAQAKTEEAIKLLDEILNEQPTDDEARAARARVLVDTGKPGNLAAALSDLETLAQKSPGDANLQFYLGRALWAKGDVERAQKALQEAGRINPRFTGAFIMLAEISERKPELNEMLRYAEQAIAVEPRNPRARLLRGMGLSGFARYDEARTQFTDLLRDFPNYLDARLQLGLLDVSQKKYNEAEALFLKLYQPGQKDVRPLAGLVQTYGAQEQYQKAFDVLNQELKKSPDSVQAKAMFADVAKRLGKLDLAASQYQELVARNPKNAEFHIRLAQLYYLTGDIPKAIAAFRQAEQLQPGNNTARTYLGVLIDESGHAEEAIAKYRELLKLEPDNPVASNNLAFLLAERGTDLEEAAGLSQRAVNKLPGNADVADTLAWVYLKRNLPDSAIQILNNLIQKNPNRALYRYHLGMALLQKGDKARARASFEAALQDKPSQNEEVKIREALSKIG